MLDPDELAGAITGRAGGRTPGNLVRARAVRQSRKGSRRCGGIC